MATIHHGIDLTAFAFRAEPDPDGHVVFFGRIHPDKGAAEAIDIARAAGRPIRLAGIVQDGDYFEAQVRPRLGRDVEYVGVVAAGDRARFLGAAAALVHPVAFAEPFGLAAVEAFACGTPVVAYGRGALPELVSPGVNGFLATDVDGAAAALDKIDGIDRGGCRLDAERRFSAERMARDYLAVYQAMLDATR